MDLTKRKQRYVNVESHSEALDADIVEVKYDGWWARCVITKGKLQIFSRQGQLKFEGEASLPDCVLIGEYIVGTQRATAGEELGKVVVFDIIEIESHNLPATAVAHWSWKNRRMTLEELDFTGTMFELIETFKPADADELWQSAVIEGGAEGLVYKRSYESYVDSTVYRKKRVFTMDYVVMDLQEGGGANEGRLGALICGLYVNGNLKRKLRVGGGFRDKEREAIWQAPEDYIGRVLEVKGWQLFDSGALRHPNACRGKGGRLRWREDKAPEDCTYGV